MALLPKVKLKAMLSFPSSVIDGAGVDVTRVNGAFKLDLAFDDFAPPVTGVPDAAHQNALLWNSATGAYVLAPITILGSGGAVPEAPNDGTQYGRQSLNWTPISAGSTVPPATVAPLMDGTAAVGTTTKYAREDHIHPIDTSRAPLASPVFTGNPQSVTPTAGDADTSIATTAFVTTAVAGVTTVTPSNANPVMDGVTVPGVSTLYSRGDHVHPTDTTRQTADADLTAIAALSGTGIAKRTATTPTWTTGDPVTNAELSNMPIYTLKGNATSSLASPTDIDIAALTLKASPAGGDFLILSDQAASGALKKVGIANLPGASAGISDAPNDGLQYGRQSLGWTVISGGGASPSSALPAMDGTAAAGVATLYSRGDHVHPTDTTRAPLASPTFTGTPAAPTAAGGTNTTQLATTAFVTTAVAAVGGVSPSNTNPIIDGTAAPGVLTTYSRGDHVHPMDAELLALAGVTSAADQVPMFTGSGTATTVTVTSAARTVLDDTTVGAMLTTLGGQPVDAELTAIAGLTSAANQVPMFTGSGTASTITVTPVAQTVLDDTTIAAMLTTLGGAPLASPVFTGNPQAPTPTAGDNDTSIATTAFVTAAIAGVSGGATNIPEIANATIAESHSSNAVTFALKTVAGTDPSSTDTVVIPFRNSAAGTGNYVYRTVTAALSLTISSGSTMGFTNATAGRIWIVLFDDGGTVRMGAINCRNGINIYPLGGFPIASATSEGGAGGADSAHVFYSSATVTSKSYYVLGYASYETGITTAGTWTASPTRLQLFYNGVPLPGTQIQIIQNYITANTTGSTTTPADNTIPQNTEGTQFATQAITPSSASNLLNVLHVGNYTPDVLSVVTSAIFQDSVANAISANATSCPANTLLPLSVDCWVLAGTSSSTTFKIRSGQSAAGTLAINVFTYGGTVGAFLRVTEYMA